MRRSRRVAGKIMNHKSFLLAATAALALTGAGRGSLYKCQSADGHVILRDRHCLAGEKVVEEIRASEVSREFTMVNTLPAAAPDDDARKKSATTPTGASKP
jgi:hypothetical protein